MLQLATSRPLGPCRLHVARPRGACQGFSGISILSATVAIESSRTLHYKRSRFTTQLPLDYLYSPSHYWIHRRDDGSWRVGLTKFAARMLGEMVDHGFELDANAPVKPGLVIGWVEGFKAIADVFCIADGVFIGPNALLKEKITLINKSPYDEGWLYAVRGAPDSRCVDVQGYRAILDRTIDKILEKQRADEIQ
jgi:glycine cleavage system H protein